MMTTRSKPVSRPGWRHWIVPIVVLVCGLAVEWWAFVKLEEVLENRQNREAMRRVALACRTYAADFDGKFPPTLNALADKGYVDQTKIWMLPNALTGDIEPVFYRQPTATSDAERNREVIMVSPPLHRNNRRVLATAGGMVSVERLTPEQVAEAEQGRWPTRH